MKLSKEELKQKASDLIEDTEKSIELLEDIEDSVESNEVDTTKIDELQKNLDELQGKYDDLQNKYKSRFLEGKDTKEKEEKEEELTEDKKVIDIKEI